MPITETAKTRDVRIDLVRGLCLWFILVDHTPENGLRDFTLRGFAQCDAADAFVFLCGVSVALAYGGKLDRAGWWQASKAVLRRMRTIYLAQVALAAALIALVAVDRAIGRVGIERSIWPGEQSFDTVALLRLAGLLDQPGNLTVLPLYLGLLSWFILIMPLMKRPFCLLALSGGLWVAVHLYPHSLRVGPYFNVLAWQLTFTLGVLCCRYAHLLRRPGLRCFDAAAVGLLAAGAWAILTLPYTLEAYDQFSPPLRVLLRGRHKVDLDPGRVFAVLAFAWLIFRHMPRDARWLRARWAAAPIALGRCSLPVFAAGVVLSGASSWVLSTWGQGFVAQIAVNAAGIAGLVAAAYLSKLRPGTIARIRHVGRPGAVPVHAGRWSAVGHAG